MGLAMGIILITRANRRFLFLRVFFDFLPLTHCQAPGATKVCSLGQTVAIAAPSLYQPKEGAIPMNLGRLTLNSTVDNYV